MEIIKEGSSTTRPLALDGNNYSYWKPHMTSFLKSLDGRVWRAIVPRWEPPMIRVDGKSIPKPKIDWTDFEEQASVGNSRYLMSFLMELI